MRLCFFCWIALLLGLQTALAKVRHVRAHDGFHNIKREAAWSHLKPRMRAHQENNRPNSQG
ncbi:uncharacterized protein [Drosophila pseudoobscura]|uniref:Uncharacterized protein n=1 Tax=Drosophila pseudoobscura pseudoobscura TaxID=46245 RepID=A0A6I8V9P6_DROPS|nr:uncharacterized protein LOC26533038 [Drosophila pseudoobscura]